jgi:N-acetylglucosamine transport system permease protein
MSALTIDRGTGSAEPSERRKPRDLRRRRRRRSPLRSIGSAVVWAIVAVDLLILAFILVSSVKTTPQILNTPWSLPTSLHFENWKVAWQGSGFGRAALTTVLLVMACCFTIVAVAAPAAYVLSRTKSRMSGGLTMFFTLGIGVPDQVIVIPLFIFMAKIGLVNSLFGLYLIYTAVSLPFTVFLLTGFFRSLPEELEEAATLDGASTFRTFWQVMLPLARSGLITAFVLNAVGLWNETLIALIFVHDTSNYTLSLSLIAFLGKIQYSGADYGGLFAGICIVVLPILCIYVWLGRRIIEGMTLGAGK